MSHTAEPIQFQPVPVSKNPKFIDLTGMTFGDVVVMFYAGSLGSKYSWWAGRCKCGTIKKYQTSSLKFGQIRSCGCRRKQTIKPDTYSCHKCKRTLPFDIEHFTGSDQHPFGLAKCCKSCTSSRKNPNELIRSRDLRIQVLQHYSRSLIPSCECCGVDDLSMLAIDHIDGDGNAHRRERGRSRKIQHRLKADGFPSGFRVLCHNCNAAHGFYGYCPHKGRPSDSRWAAPPDANGNQYSKRHRDRVTVFAHYGQQCELCQESSPEFLTVDHMNGNGNKHRKTIRCICEWLILNQFPNGFRILCQNCNLAKSIRERQARSSA
jgi:hypothetical protein